MLQLKSYILSLLFSVCDAKIQETTNKLFEYWKQTFIYFLVLENIQLCGAKKILPLKSDRIKNNIKD